MASFWRVGDYNSATTKKPLSPDFLKSPFHKCFCFNHLKNEKRCKRIIVFRGVSPSRKPCCTKRDGYNVKHVRLFLMRFWTCPIYQVYYLTDTIYKPLLCPKRCPTIIILETELGSIFKQ